MLLCCGRQFFAAEKVILPKKDKLYRCLEFGFCPNCGTRVSRFIEQDKNYEVTIKERRGIKALRAYEKAVLQHNRFFGQSSKTGSKAAENFYFGDFRRTKRLDENNQPIYLQLKKNFNNKTEILGEVATYYYKI